MKRHLQQRNFIIIIIFHINEFIIIQIVNEIKHNDMYEISSSISEYINI